MKNPLWHLITLALLLFQLNGCGDDAPQTTAERVEALLELSADTTAGQTVYTANCAVCHGTSGEGSSSTPAMGEVVPGKTDTHLSTVVIDGTGVMMGLGALLSDQEIADVVTFIKTLN